MRNRMIPRLLAGLLVAGSLAACIPGGITPEPEAKLILIPAPPVLDLPSTGEGSDSQVMTVVNVGNADTGNLNVDTSLNGITFEVGIIIDDCAHGNLRPGGRCHIDITAGGTAPTTPYSVTISVYGDDSGSANTNVFFE